MEWFCILETNLKITSAKWRPQLSTNSLQATLSPFGGYLHNCSKALITSRKRLNICDPELKIATPRPFVQKYGMEARPMKDNYLIRMSFVRTPVCHPRIHPDFTRWILMARVWCYCYTTGETTALPWAIDIYIYICIYIHIYIYIYSCPLLYSRISLVANKKSSTVDRPTIYPVGWALSEFPPDLIHTIYNLWQFSNIKGYRTCQSAIFRHICNIFLSFFFNTNIKINRSILCMGERIHCWLMNGCSSESVEVFESKNVATLGKMNRQPSDSCQIFYHLRYRGQTCAIPCFGYR